MGMHILELRYVRAWYQEEEEVRRTSVMSGMWKNKPRLTPKITPDVPAPALPSNIFEESEKGLVSFKSDMR